MELKEARCVVTGATSGIGRATAIALAQQGATLIAVGRNTDALADISSQTSVHPLHADLATPQGIASVVSEVTTRWGSADVLVNNAGVGVAGEVASASAADIDRAVDVNLRAPLRLTAALLPAMLTAGRGYVINVASIAGHTGNPQETIYAGTKAALIGFTHSLAQELRTTGVRVCLVSPGAVDTAFFERRGVPYGRGWPRRIDPAEVARAIVGAIERNREDVFVPAWMRFPARLSGASPRLFRALAARFG